MGYRRGARVGRLDGGVRGDQAPGVAGPDEDAASLIDGEALALDELIFERLQVRLVELELELERAIGQAAPLAQQRNRLIHHRDKVHPLSSLPDALSEVRMHVSIIP